MKKIKRRAYSIFLLVTVIAVCLLVFLFRLAADGDAWVTFPSNRNVYTDGQLAVGTVYDRNGTILMEPRDGRLQFHENADVRRAMFHILGDRAGNVATGINQVWAERLIGYNPITGTYSLGGRGNSIQITIDAELNRVAYQALAGRRGAVVVMNYETGELLSLVSTPSYDPNYRPEMQEGDPNFEGVYINRVFSAAFPPGSVFKVVTAAAALDTYPDAPGRRYTCNGHYTVAGNRVTCLGNHGTIGLEEALGVSCNPYFAQLALDLGGNRLQTYTERFGLTSPHNLHGISVVPGNFTAGEANSPALAWSGVGQSENLINPLSMVRFMGAIARGGEPVEPRLLESVSAGLFPRRYDTIETGERILDASVSNQLALMLRSISNRHYSGTFPGLYVAGKTGTAEVADRPPHAWFVGFLDDAEHPLAFVVIVENAGFGLAQAGPVANAVLQAAVRG